MANIIAYIRKEVEKGNTLMDKKGNFVNPEKLENKMSKAYVTGLNNGSVSFEKPFAEYQQDEIEKLFIPVSAFESNLYYSGLLQADVLEDMPEPCDSVPEPQETIAQ